MYSRGIFKIHSGDELKIFRTLEANRLLRSLKSVPMIDYSSKLNVFYNTATAISDIRQDLDYTAT